MPTHQSRPSLLAAFSRSRTHESSKHNSSNTEKDDAELEEIDITDFTADNGDDNYILSPSTDKVAYTMTYENPFHDGLPCLELNNNNNNTNNNNNSAFQFPQSCPVYDKCEDDVSSVSLDSLRRTNPYWTPQMEHQMSMIPPPVVISIPTPRAVVSPSATLDASDEVLPDWQIGWLQQNSSSATTETEEPKPDSSVTRGSTVSPPTSCGVAIPPSSRPQEELYQRTHSQPQLAMSATHERTLSQPLSMSQHQQQRHPLQPPLPNFWSPNNQPPVTEKENKRTTQLSFHRLNEHVRKDCIDTDLADVFRTQMMDPYRTPNTRQVLQRSSSHCSSHSSSRSRRQRLPPPVVKDPLKHPLTPTTASTTMSTVSASSSVSSSDEVIQQSPRPGFWSRKLISPRRRTYNITVKSKVDKEHLSCLI